MKRSSQRTPWRSLSLAAGVALVATALSTPLTAGAASPNPHETGPLREPSPCNVGLRLDPRASDEFSAPLGHKWDVYDFDVTFRDTPEGFDIGRRSRELVYRPDMVRVADGVMTLSIVDEPANVDGKPGLEYPAGGIQSTFDVPGAQPGRPSCVEVRTQGFAANVASQNAWDQNVFSAVWLQTRPPSYAENPNPEIDIQEFFVSDAQHMALHEWTSPPPPAPALPTGHVGVDNCRTGRADNTVDPEGMIDDCMTELKLGNLTDDFHVFALRREIVEIEGRMAGMLTFYTDGVVTWRKEFPADSPFVTADRNLVLSTQGNPPGGPGLAFPKEAHHDWVRTWR